MSATSYSLLEVVQLAGFRAGNLKERITTVENPNPEMFNFVEVVNEILQRMNRAKPLPVGNAETVITTLDDYDTGTISDVTQGEQEINGLVTGWTGIDVPQGMAFSVADRNEIYRVSFVSTDTALTVTEPWAGTDVTSANPLGYTLAQDRYDLPDDFSDFISVTLEGDTSRPLDIVRPSEIDQQRYAMSLVPMTLGSPLRCSLFHVSSSGQRQIVVDPFPDSIYRLRVKYIKTAGRLSHNKDVVPVFNKNIWTLIDGVTARWKFITAENDAAKSDWVLWQREELPRYLSFDRETTDEVPHMVPDDVVRTATPTSLIG